jgi:hypothetical protein
VAAIRYAPRNASSVVYYIAESGQFTRYWKRGESESNWREIGWADVPKPAYQKLRERLRANMRQKDAS